MRFRTLLVDASTGDAIGEPPITISSFSYQLNGVGQLTGTLPRDHRLAQDIYWALYLSTNSDRELTVTLDDIPVWNGPVTILQAAKTDGQMQVTAREASWYLQKRTLEVDKNYLGWDLFDVVRDLVGTYMITKTSTAGDGTTSAGSNINADLPRWIVSPVSAPSGFTLPSTNVPSYYGAALHLISDVLDEELVPDPEQGIDYKMVYTGDRVRCQREFTVGAPLGTLLPVTLNEGNSSLDFGKTEDRERAANRVHGEGSGYTKTLQNTGSTANGDLLIEAKFDASNLKDQATIDAFTRSRRRAAQPPVAVYTAVVPLGRGLPFGWCSVGDRVNLGFEGSTILHSEGHVRITALEVHPHGQVPSLAVTFGVPLDALGV